MQGGRGSHDLVDSLKLAFVARHMSMAMNGLGVFSSAIKLYVLPVLNQVRGKRVRLNMPYEWDPGYPYSVLKEDIHEVRFREVPDWSYRTLIKQMMYFQ